MVSRLARSPLTPRGSLSAENHFNVTDVLHVPLLHGSFLNRVLVVVNSDRRGEGICDVLVCADCTPTINEQMSTVKRSNCVKNDEVTRSERDGINSIRRFTPEQYRQTRFYKKLELPISTVNIEVIRTSTPNRIISFITLRHG